MTNYVIKHADKWMKAFAEHIWIVLITLLLSVLLASALTIGAMYVNVLGKILIQIFSVIYSIPSLALFALFIPLTGLGMDTAIIVLVLYNQYLLLRNFITGLNEVDPAILEAATGMGMTKVQILVQVQLPLARKALFTGLRLAVVSTIGIATIAASINAGGLGSILFDGLRTMNVYKIVWGAVLAGGFAIVTNEILQKLEK
ncbi:MAG: ABC transporter permease [Lachnospiraceae bacterium]|nr:ABC transporter permease [Lachnospiraceae bacterium]